jgi:hypothetical protein
MKKILLLYNRMYEKAGIYIRHIPSRVSALSAGDDFVASTRLPSDNPRGYFVLRR